ncbi:glutamate ligase domain-containing protein, partial [Streptococcus pyogenes]
DLHVILTADDPNREDPQKIAQEIASYVDRPLEIIVDREEAIKKALTMTSGPTDAVIIAGKGADAYQIVNDEKLAYA